MKEALCTHPILQYPDPERQYVLFTDASKYRWAGVLTQLYEEINELAQIQMPIQVKLLLKELRSNQTLTHSSRIQGFTSHITTEVKVNKVTTSQRCQNKQHLTKATGR